MSIRVAARPLLAIAVLTALFSSPQVNTPAGHASTVDRTPDPVVLTGTDTPELIGVEPAQVVAFRYDVTWQQIPVQIDERAEKDFGDIYNDGQYGASALVYADNDTFTGPDPDPSLDIDDEIVFMARDAGDAAPASSEPAHVVPGSGVEVTIIDPLLGGGYGYAYLFESDGTLDPAAGLQYVSYSFNLLSGDYKDTYRRFDGPNPEDSLIVTPYYSHHFSDRWISDEVTVTMGDATGVDILDRHKNLFAPGNCVRSENTFCDGEGAFIVNKSGPVRALRSYIGANSGPVTQRDNIFYERRQEIRTYLRVHAIVGMMDFFDYSPAAAGMTYYNNLNLAGVTIDGEPDTVAAGAIQWEMVTGEQGSLVLAGSVSTNITGLNPTSYYLDDTTPPVTQCTGDSFAYGSSGTWMSQEIPCTDPRPSYNCTNFLNAMRVLYYESPGLSVDDAQMLAAQIATPLSYTTRPFGDSDGDGIPSDSDNCPSVPNPDQSNTMLGPIDNGLDVPGDDVTNPYEDDIGDACDDDADNDGLPDGQESDSACPYRLVRDSDGDGALDGYEVTMGNDPCASPDRPPPGSSVDSDGDGLSDGMEVRGWGTDARLRDSDRDGCDDDKEVASVNDDRQATVPDVMFVAKAALVMLPCHPSLDLTRNGACDISDAMVSARNSTLVEPHPPCP